MQIRFPETVQACVFQREITCRIEKITNQFAISCLYPLHVPDLFLTPISPILTKSVELSLDKKRSHCNHHHTAPNSKACQTHTVINIRVELIHWSIVLWCSACLHWTSPLLKQFDCTLARAIIRCQSS